MRLLPIIEDKKRTKVSSVLGPVLEPVLEPVLNSPRRHAGTMSEELLTTGVGANLPPLRIAGPTNVRVIYRGTILLEFLRRSPGDWNELEHHVTFNKPPHPLAGNEHCCTACSTTHYVVRGSSMGNYLASLSSRPSQSLCGRRTIPRDSCAGVESTLIAGQVALHLQQENKSYLPALGRVLRSQIDFLSGALVEGNTPPGGVVPTDRKYYQPLMLRRRLS